MNKFEKKKGSAYFHINNGGINLNIMNNITEYDDTINNIIIHNEIPILEISASHFGIQTNNIKIPMSALDMEKIGKWLINMSKKCEDFQKLNNCYIPTIEEGVIIESD